MKYFIYSLMLFFLMTQSIAQPTLKWSSLPELPGGAGWAGMYAGVSHNTLIAMGGANFPGKYPWEGGKKKWYDTVYVLNDGAKWEKAIQALSVPSAYGVSVSHKNKIIVIGGSNENGHLSRVQALEWSESKLIETDLPQLPLPLANMAGLMIGEVIVIFGGNNAATGSPTKTCLALDMNNIPGGWFELDSWPGREMIFPVCTQYQGQCYLFGGETTAMNTKGEKFRAILLDSYRMTLHRKGHEWAASWEILSPMPRGASAAGTILPVLNKDRFLFWGGVDAVTALYDSPETHPGITESLLYYFPETNRWEYIGKQTAISARVTLPVVFWNNQWVYMSGEVKPGIRTPTVVGVQ